jgi:hypothetical protein
MAIKRYYATKDNTITNAFKSDLITRGTGSNMGASDILESFVIHGQTSASINAANAEQSRILLEFPIDEILLDIESGVVPSASVQYNLNLFNAPHAGTTPLSYSLQIEMISGSSWNEGRGLDMEQYSDIGSSNWLSSSLGIPWVNPGGDVWAGSAYSSSFFFSGGAEDVSLNVDFALNKWRISASSLVNNYGFLIKNTNAAISGAEGTLYTKKFFGRTSEFFLKRPYLEARWNSSRKDNRGNFLASSSLLPAADNLNTLYLYNNVRGTLKNIPGLEGGASQIIFVSIFSGTLDGTPTGSALTVLDADGASVTNISGGILLENGKVVTGVYTASFASTSSIPILCDVWHSGTGGSTKQFWTSSYSPEDYRAQSLDYNTQYRSSLTNLQPSYEKGDKPILRLFVRKKDWDPNIYDVANVSVPTEIIENAAWRIERTIDALPIVPFGTGSYNYTLMSYDVSGNYFELDTSYLDRGYSYAIKVAYEFGGRYREQEEEFKFRIDEETP